ncbi:hypothetical protein EPD62_005960 [Acetivibrio thermocellus]|uniref:hypothetical protein n=1 Tax=Acetivibrio thermocellus TaxID=1515 RepID=UPI0010A5AD1F|nr:hypothetical protein [Acetivibrio thermocellus]THJ79063.1 hypothetical protein EPD62_02890 [Acetivibrio thermocellus]
MIRIVYFEIRKNYLRSYVVIALLSFLLINILIIYKDYLYGPNDLYGYFLPHTAEYQKWWQSYQEMYDKVSGKLTADKARFVVSEYRRLDAMVADGTYSREKQEGTYTGYIWGDYVFITKYFYRPMKYVSTYESAIKQVIENAKANIEFYSQCGNNFDKSKNEFIVKHYSGRKIDVFHNGKFWGLLFEYDFSDLLIVLLLLLGVAPMFVNEKNTNMDKLILSSIKGKFSMTFVKVFSIFLYTAFLVIVFSGINFLVCKFLYGLSGIQMPIYAVEAYQYTPLNCSVGMFYVLQTLLKAVGLFVFATWICLLSALFQRVVYPYAISTLSVVLGIYASGYVASVETSKTIWALMSPFTLLRANKLFNELLGINIRDTFYLRAHVALIVQIFIVLMIFILIYMIVSIRDLRVIKKLITRESS